MNPDNQPVSSTPLALKGMEWMVDAGNTLVKWGVFDPDGNLVRVVKSPLHRLEAGAKEALETGRPVAVTVASVSLPKEHWERWMMDHASVTMRWMGDYRNWPFETKYRDPDRLGTDRKVQMAGALAMYGRGPVMVMGLGTCLTVDWLKPAGPQGSPVHQGGWISPGLRMRLRAMNRDTAALPDLEPGTSVQEGPGLDTGQSMLAGVWQGYLAELREHVRRWKEVAPGAVVVVCGGDADLIPWNQITDYGSIFAAPDLALHGMYSLTRPYAF